MSMFLSRPNLSGNNCLSIIVISLISYAVYKIVVTVYIVFYGPLSKFPGPKHRAFTNLFEICSMVSGNDNTNRPALHKKYGPVVRVGPNTLSFAGGETVWKDIHGFNATKEGGIRKEGLFYSKIFGFSDAANLITDRDTASHARQRKILARSFGNTALIEQQPIFARWAEKFLSKLAENAGLIEEIDISNRAARLLADTFLKYNPTVQKKQLENWKYCSERVDRRLQRTPIHPDLWSRILDKSGDRDCLSMDEQYANGFLFMTAGTETISSALSATTFHLLRNPQYLERLTREIRSTFSTVGNMSLEGLASLSYLQAVIQEGLRLNPPLPIALPREIPKGGAQICGEWIPGGTTVGIHYLSIHTQEQYFKKALEFHPQRWLRDSEFENDNLDMAKPFLMGPYNCIGKDLAMHEIRLLLATVLLHFDIKLSHESLNWDDMKVFTLWDKKPLLCELTFAKAVV
ncbi:cytochrome P450 [Leptodontidium sp. MPI-SDFR-AT-0119]|nr:cytochrome P450 [Leptodontidium sp. MPI-SDFR-AT-0119]